jgi:hypothetical protein
MTLANFEVLHYSDAHVPRLACYSIAGFDHIALVIDNR